MTKKIIHIFKNDLRLSDNPAFTEASKSGHIIPIYIGMPHLGMRVS